MKPTKKEIERVMKLYDSDEPITNYIIRSGTSTGSCKKSDLGEGKDATIFDW